MRYLRLIIISCACIASISGSSQQRSVQLRDGVVHTYAKGAASIDSQTRRRLGAGTQDGLFLLGHGGVDAPTELQTVLKAQLLALGGQLLYPCSEDHWLVRASDEAVAALLELPGITAAPLPDGFKQGRSLSALQRALKQVDSQQASGGRVRTAALVTESAARTSSAASAASTASAADTRLPKALQGVRLTGGADGLPPRLSLLVLGSKPAIGEIQALREAAKSWAVELQHGLTTALMRTLDGSTARADEGDDAAASACSPTVKALGGTGTATATLCVQDLEPAISWLLAQPSVLLVDVPQTAHLTDVWASAVTQAGQVPNPLSDISKGGPGVFPMWAAGLDGRGQVVGIVDTGMDMDSCYFWDPNIPEVDQTDMVDLGNGSEAAAFISETHRKLAMYLQLGDWQDNSDSHGTHVAGLVAGSAAGFNATEQPDIATGLAPGARIAFVDVSAPSEDNDVLVLPDDPYVLYDPLYNRGVRITSNSFAYSLPDPPEYSLDLCSVYDSYVWNRQDMLLLYAAGNSGALTDYEQYGVVEAPAICKNTVAVGATENYIYRQSQLFALVLNGTQPVHAPIDTANLTVTTDIKSLLFQGFDKVTGELKESLELYLGPDLVYWIGPSASFGLLVGVELSVAQPANAASQLACAPLSNTALKGKFVLFKRGTCNFATKGKYVVAAGAAAGLIYNDRADDPSELVLTPEASSLSEVKIPLGGTSLALGTTISNWIAKKQYNVTVRAMALGDAHPPQDNVLAASSFGAVRDADEAIAAAQDLRVKPDIMAAGFTRSALSDGKMSMVRDSCATSNKAGTSMSTPIVAGAAAIIRQYFVDGYYPAGEPTPGAGYEPSGSMLRAVLMGGAAAMTGVSRNNGRALKPPPSPFQGFGRVDLSRSLPLKGDEDGWAMQVIDRASFEDRGEHTYEVVATGTAPIITTLAYVDWPEMVLRVPGVNNDLDLLIQGPSFVSAPPAAAGGGSGSGSGGAPDSPPATESTTWWGNDQLGGDNRNNVERIVITHPVAGATYTITVKAYDLYIDAKPARYALAVLGGLNSTIESPFNPAIGPQPLLSPSPPRSPWPSPDAPYEPAAPYTPLNPSWPTTASPPPEPPEVLAQPDGPPGPGSPDPPPMPEPPSPVLQNPPPRSFTPPPTIGPLTRAQWLRIREGLQATRIQDGRTTNRGRSRRR